MTRTRIAQDLLAFRDAERRIRTWCNLTGPDRLESYQRQRRYRLAQRALRKRPARG